MNMTRSALINTRRQTHAERRNGARQRTIASYARARGL